MNRKIFKILILIIILIAIVCVPKTEYAKDVSIIVGDINGDGEINSIDSMRAIYHATAKRNKEVAKLFPNWILTGNEFIAGDVNGDGEVDSLDSMRIIYYDTARRNETVAKKYPEWKKYIEGKNPTITIDQKDAIIEKGSTIQLKAIINPENATDKMVVWESSDEKIAIVDGVGIVKGINEGTTMIKAKISNGKYAICVIKVKATSIPEQNTNPSTNNNNNNNSNNNSNNNNSSNNSSNNINSNNTKSKKSVETTTQTTSKQNTTPVIKSISNAAITINSKTLTYNGNAQTPILTVKDGNTVLKNGIDYTVAYLNNKNAGIATARITGKGNYTGSKNANFTINKATYNMNNVKFANETITYDGKKHSILAKGLPAGVSVAYTGNGKTEIGTYIVTAKFTGDAKNYNAIPNKNATLRINAKDISKASISKVEKQYYVGNAIKPTVIVKYGKETLKKGTDYTISYTNNIDSEGNGKGTIKITGKGKYTGSKQISFTIENMGNKLAKKACELSYSRQVYHGNGYDGTKAMLKANKAYPIYSKDPKYIRHCAATVATICRATNYDKKFKGGLTKYPYMNDVYEHLNWKEKGKITTNANSNWKYIGEYEDIKKAGKLLPGDIVVSDIHVCMYVGAKIPIEIYNTKLKGTDADVGKPGADALWVSAHYKRGFNKERNAAACICNEKKASPSYKRPVVYRCVKPDWYRK